MEKMTKRRLLETADLDALHRDLQHARSCADTLREGLSAAEARISLVERAIFAAGGAVGVNYPDALSPAEISEALGGVRWVPHAEFEAAPRGRLCRTLGWDQSTLRVNGSDLPKVAKRTAGDGPYYGWHSPDASMILIASEGEAGSFPVGESFIGHGPISREISEALGGVTWLAEVGFDYMSKGKRAIRVASPSVGDAIEFEKMANSVRSIFPDGPYFGSFTGDGGHIWFTSPVSVGFVCRGWGGKWRK